MKDQSVKNLVAIDCTFLIDSKSTYNYMYEFEYALMDFFAERDMDFEIVKGLTGSNTRKMYVISKKQSLKPPAIPQPVKVKAPITNQQKVLQKRK